eukprot:s55_g37.t1
MAIWNQPTMMNVLDRHVFDDYFRHAFLCSWFAEFNRPKSQLWRSHHRDLAQARSAVSRLRRPQQPCRFNGNSSGVREWTPSSRCNRCTSESDEN